MRFVTMHDARAHLNLTNSTPDDEVFAFAETADAKVAEIIGAMQAAGTRTVTRAPYRGEVVLPESPVSDVIAVTGSNGLPVTNWTADLAAGLLYVNDWGPVTVTYTVTAQAGVPAPLTRTATLMILARMWETQRGASPSPLQGGGDPTFTPGLQGILGEVRALLGSYASR